MAFDPTPFNASPSVSFGPSRVDINWDGQSFGKITLAPAYPTTNATHTVQILHVFPAAETKTIYAAGVTQSYSATAGSPFYNNHTANAEVAVPFSVGVTLSTATTGEFSFSLDYANTNYTARLDYTTHRTMQASYYSWQAKQAGAGDGDQSIVASGRLTRIPPNPFQSTNVNGTLVSGTTAFFSIE